MRITFIIIFLFFHFSFAQQIDSSTEKKHSFQLGYSEIPRQYFGFDNCNLTSFSYSYEDGNSRIKVSYFYSKSNEINGEYEGKPVSRKFVPTIEYNFEHVGFALGVMFINQINTSPEFFLFPVGNLKLGFISNYYISADFLTEGSIPTLSFNLNYIFSHPLSFLKIGTSNFDSWSYNSEIQYSFFDFVLFRLRGIYNPKIDRGFYYASIGFFIII